MNLNKACKVLEVSSVNIDEATDDYEIAAVLMVHQSMGYDESMALAPRIRKRMSSRLWRITRHLPYN